MKNTFKIIDQRLEARCTNEVFNYFSFPSLFRRIFVVLFNAEENIAFSVS